jgi:hypothetical protein
MEQAMATKDHRDAAQRVKEWRKRNPEKRRAQEKRYRQRHPETGRKASRKYNKTHPEERFRHRMNYERKQEEKLVLIAKRPRPSVCDLCRNRGFRIVFDHCHKHGHFRGWLCHRCNTVLGLVGDDAELLRKMIKYLKENKMPTSIRDPNAPPDPAELNFDNPVPWPPGYAPPS